MPKAKCAQQSWTILPNQLSHDSNPLSSSTHSTQHFPLSLRIFLCLIDMIMMQLMMSDIFEKENKRNKIKAKWYAKKNKINKNKKKGGENLFG